jgi:hypothetical protein
VSINSRFALDLLEADFLAAPFFLLDFAVVFRAAFLANQTPP